MTGTLPSRSEGPLGPAPRLPAQKGRSGPLLASCSEGPLGPAPRAPRSEGPLGPAAPSRSEGPTCESKAVTYPTYVPDFPRAWRHNRRLANATVGAFYVALAVASIVQVIAIVWLAWPG